MEIVFSKKDLEIGVGIQELFRIAEADIKSAHGGESSRILPSPRTIELYDVKKRTSR